jgi:hypothetical protein
VQYTPKITWVTEISLLTHGFLVLQQSIRSMRSRWGTIQIYVRHVSHIGGWVVATHVQAAWVRIFIKGKGLLATTYRFTGFFLTIPFQQMNEVRGGSISCLHDVARQTSPNHHIHSRWLVSRRIACPCPFPTSFGSLGEQTHVWPRPPVD